MPHGHVEAHKKSSENIRDFIIGMADGLTVPFALVAGLSGVIDSTGLTITAGVAEIAAGSIAMGLGGYLATRSQREHYESELVRETIEIEKYPEVEAKEVQDILEEFGVEKEHSLTIIEAFRKNPEKWREFMMRFELGLEKPKKNREYISALTIGSAYVLGGSIPLLPYLFTHDIKLALLSSVIITVTTLLIFGAVKGALTGVSPLKAAIHTCLIGSAAASIAYMLARLVS